MLDELLGPTIRQVKSPLTDKMLAPPDPRCERIQFDSLLTDTDFERLSVFMEQYPDVGLRAYGGASTTTIHDLEFLRFFPQLRLLQVDVYHLRDASGLRYVHDGLLSFGFGWTKSRRQFSLAPLTRFTSLRTLFIEGHTKDIDSIATLAELEDLTLRSITLPDLTILLPLKRLRSLDIKLGGTRDLNAVPGLPSLEFLELWQIRGLSDLDPIGELGSLQFLFLQSLRQVERLPSFARCHSLRRIHLETMNGLSDLSQLCTAPALEEILIFDMAHLSVDDLRCLTRIETLRQAAVYLGSKRKNAAAKDLLGLPTAERFGFEFR